MGGWFVHDGYHCLVALLQFPGVGIWFHTVLFLGEERKMGAVCHARIAGGLFQDKTASRSSSRLHGSVTRA